MMKRKIKFNGHSEGGAIGGQSDTSAATNGNLAPAGGTRKTRILIVEDEPAMVAGLRDNFEYEGYEVISAADGAEGLARALSDNPDLVVLDVMMPRMSGLDVCKQLKAKQPSLPIGGWFAASKCHDTTPPPSDTPAVPPSSVYTPFDDVDTNCVPAGKVSVTSYTGHSAEVDGPHTAIVQP